MRDLIDIVKIANQHPHQGYPRKMKVYDILQRKYTESFENKEMDVFSHVAYAMAKTKWHEYLKSLGMTFDIEEGILDPSCHLEWQQRWIKISEETMNKILTLGLP
jgi:hypothetical protein